MMKMKKRERTQEQIERDRERTVFAVRVVLWSLFSCILPVAFIGWRYDIFRKAGSLQLSGWGLIGVVIAFAFIYVVVKYVRAGFVEWSMWKQVINGIVKVIFPLSVFLALMVSVRDNIDALLQSLSCIIACEVVAIPINPFPEWVWKKTKGRFESAVDYMVDRFYSRGNNDSNSKGE